MKTFTKELCNKVISAKIPERLYKKMKKKKWNVSQSFREFLEQALKD